VPSVVINPISLDNHLTKISASLSLSFEASVSDVDVELDWAGAGRAIELKVSRNEAKEYRVSE
jgi:hypothetical protein